MDPFLWENGKMTDLGTLGGVFGTALCANNRAQVIGQSSLAESPGACNIGTGSIVSGCHAFLWEKGTLQDLGTLGGTSSIALWLNNAGEVVGAATAAGDQVFHATLWRRGLITDLGTLPGDCFSRANVINSKDQIIGWSFNCDTNTFKAVLWDKGSIFDLNALIPANANLQLVSGTDINNRGEILAAGMFANGDVHDVLLIPCQVNQGDAVDCNDPSEGTTVARQERPFPITIGASSNQAPLSPSEYSLFGGHDGRSGITFRGV
jgi:probable HAF family extracellular repeat protein